MRGDWAMSRLGHKKLESNEGEAGKRSQELAAGKPIFYRMLLIMLGFGLFRGWSVIGGSPTLFVPSGSIAVFAEANAGLWEDIVYAVILVAIGVAAQKSARFSREKLMVVSCTVVCLGTALFVFSYVTDDAPLLLPMAGRVLFAAAACIAMLWGEQLCYVGIKESLICISGAYAFSYVMALAGTGFSKEAVAVLQVALPVASLALWFLVRKSYPRERLVAIESGRDGSLRAAPYRVFLGIGIFGAILLLANGLSEGKTSVPDELLTLVVGLATSLVILGIARLYRHPIDFTLVFRLMLPIIVVCIFLVFFIEADQQPYEVAFIGFSWTFFIVFAWELWRIAASRTALSPLAVFSFGSAFLSVSTLIGSGIQLIAGVAGASSLVVVAVICIVSVLVSSFLLNDQKVREIVQGKSAFLDRDDESACRLCVDKASATIKLTEREQEIALRVLQGKDNALVASELFITTATLYTHLRNIYKKADVHSKQEFIAFLRSFA
ncbi:helix-turn-helix transcriptional regulator [Raoultibacter phocaeensis]|uniref:helix-turn-helix transcriptional regulator n=1 Tax=Raoultibacter phocaeensis TaxID=2479841 RepID=UPI0015D620AC|nr:helix-turn-helix transcriptional regulator [Raoultibacter phocaeensis]